MKRLGNRPKQEALPLGKAEATEELAWMDYVDGPNRDRSGDNMPIYLGYKDGKWTIDEVEATFQEILHVGVRGLDVFKKNPIFKKIWEKETGEKLN